MALAAVIICGIVYCVIHVLRLGYLPPPFFFEPSDTFADWFNPAFWSRQEGSYDTWRTIYLPLSFVFLRLTTLDRCYPDTRGLDASAGLAARDCDWLALLTMAIIFVVNIVLTWRVMRHYDEKTAVMRTICLALGAPMLNGLERGNLIILAYTCLLLAFGPLLSSARLRWVFAGLAINLKIYLLATVAATLLRRRWRWTEGAALATVLIYLVSLALHGHGTPTEILTNIRDFSAQGANQILDVWYTTTYLPFISLLETGAFPMAQIIGSVWVERLQFLLPAMIRLTQGLIALAALAIWYRPELYANSRAIGLGALAAIVTSEPGGYSMVIFMLFVLMEPWRGFGRKWAITACYVLAFPFDIPIDRLPESARELYFWGGTTMISNQVTLGPFVRPLIIMSVAWAIALTTLHELWRNRQDEQRLGLSAIP
jgi:hypothetical protein